MKEASDMMVKEAEKIIDQINRQQKFGPLGHDKYRIFKVHQVRTFYAEYTGGYVWAPASGIHHHERLTQIRPGDIISHYANGNMVAVGEAVSRFLIIHVQHHWPGTGGV